MLSSIVAARVTPGGVRLRAEPVGALESADSFRQLMDAELDQSYRFATVILRDAADAEDAVHDAALAAWRAWKDLRDPDSAAAWFRRILINTCRDRLRRRKRLSLRVLLRGPHDAEMPAVGDAVDVIAGRDFLRTALKALSADEQVVIALRYGDDLTVPSIADALGLAQGTVKSRLHNAVRKLRGALEETAE